MRSKTLCLAVSVIVLAACATPMMDQASASLALPSGAQMTGDKLGEVYAKPDKILIRIGREFPAFDTDYSGELAPYEFQKWMNPLIDLRLRYDEETVGDAQISSFIDASFVEADQDGNGELSDKELAVFLGQEI